MIPAKTPSKNPPSISTLTPWKPNCRASSGRTYVYVYIWIPRLLVVLSAIQSPRRRTWTTRRVESQIFHPPWGLLVCHHYQLLPYSSLHPKSTSSLLLSFQTTVQCINECGHGIHSRNAPFLLLFTAVR